MKQVADGLHQLAAFPPNAINVYLMGDVVVDAASRHAARRILRQLRGHRVTAHALTHAHPDHQGSSARLCRELEIPYWCGEGDVAAAQSGAIARYQPDRPINRLMHRLMSGPGQPVDRPLREGDEVAGFTVLEVPGHSAGHLAYWRETDRALVLGDVINNMDVRTGIPGLHEPPAAFTPDPARNRVSARRLAALEPALVCFGHGPPCTTPPGSSISSPGCPNRRAVGAWEQTKRLNVAVPVYMPRSGISSRPTRPGGRHVPLFAISHLARTTRAHPKRPTGRSGVTA